MPACVAPAESARLLAAAPQLGVALIEKLSAPFVLSELKGWHAARRKLLMFGQETAGWGGVNRGDRVAGKLDYWLQGDPTERAEQLATFHRELHAEPNRTSPFWRAHNELVDALDGWAVAWSNLMRVDTSPLGESSCSAWWNLSYGGSSQRLLMAARTSLRRNPKAETGCRHILHGAGLRLLRCPNI